jgi:chromosome segregation ATPase
MRRRDDEDLALDRIDGATNAASSDLTFALTIGGEAAGNDPPRHSVDELRTELAQLRERIAREPDPTTDQLQAARHARAEANSVAEEARARIADLEQPARGVLRRRPSDPAALAFERERLKAAQQQHATAAERERALAPNTPDGTNPEHEALRESAAALEAKLSILRQQHVRDRLEHGATHLTAVLGPLPEQPRARHTWQQAAQRIETYRFDHAITDTDNALGPPPTATAARAHWQRVQQNIHKTQRELGLHVERRLGRQL